MVKTKYSGLYYYKDEIKGKVYIAQFKIDGKRYRKIVGFSNDQYRTTEKIAFLNKEALVQEYKNDLPKIVKEQKKYTFDELYVYYKISVQEVHAKSTIETKEYYYNKHISKKLGKKIVTDLQTHDFQLIVNELLTTINPKTKECYAPQTVEHINNVSRAILTYAVERKIVSENVAQAVKIPTFDNRIDYDLTPDEAKSLVNTILTFEEEVYRGIFTFLLHGHRKDEVLSLQWKDKGKSMVDFDNMVYKIPYIKNKIKKNKIHPITQELYEILINIDDRTDYVFKNPKTGTRFHDVRKAWDRIKAQAKITKPFRIHDIRHLIGYTTLNELGLSSNIGSSIIGNSPKVFEDRYSGIKVETVRKTMNLMLEHFKN